jgi:protein tyrosine/serine phosphatase
VHRDDIFADFLLSNDPARVERDYPLFAAYIAETAGRVPESAAVLVATCVEAGYLDATLDGLRERCGSVKSYLENTLGVDRSARAAIEARLLGVGPKIVLMG